MLFGRMGDEERDVSAQEMFTNAWGEGAQRRRHFFTCFQTMLEEAKKWNLLDYDIDNTDDAAEGNPPLLFSALRPPSPLDTLSAA